MGSVPKLGRSSDGGHGNQPQYSCLENPMDRGAWPATVHRVSKGPTWLTEHDGKQNQVADGFLVMVPSFPSLFHPLPPVFFHPLQVCGPYVSPSISPLQLPPFLLLLSLNSPISSFCCPPFFALSNQTHHSVHKLDIIIELISLSL